MPKFDAKNRKKDIREVYDQVPEGIRLMSEAVPYILRELDLTPCDESEGIESTRIVIDVQNISDTLTKRGYGNFEQTEEYDPKSTEIAKHIIGLLVRYPFLWHKKIDSRKASSEDLANIFTEQSCNHLFDDLPGLYGITDIQGQQIRRSVQKSFYSDDALTTEEVKSLIEESRQEVEAKNN